MDALPEMTKAGQTMYDLLSHLYPICRSITGDGLRQTLRIIQKEIPIEIHEVPTGTKVFDWIVPREWNIRDAWISDSTGKRLVDFQECNLHVVNYSTPVRGRMKLAELRPHLFTVPTQPDWIPYRTTYYKEDWGFCLSESKLAQFDSKTEYDVCIDSSLQEGSLSFGELFLAGAEEREVLISCHACHPSLADDNLSGIVVAVELAKRLAERPRRYSYRFLFVPGTIGAITWLAQKETTASRISHGLVLTCVGDSAHLTYKRSREGKAEIDRAVAHVLTHSGQPFKVVDFTPYGYDERQYCSPGFNLAVGCLMRSRHGEFPEYHTSGDNIGFVKPSQLEDTLEKLLDVVEVLENNRSFINQNPKCEPQLGRRGLYQKPAGEKDRQSRERALLWVLNLSDGMHSLLDIAERAQLPFRTVSQAAAGLMEANLIAASGEKEIK